MMYMVQGQRWEHKRDLNQIHWFSKSTKRGTYGNIVWHVWRTSITRNCWTRGLRHEKKNSNGIFKYRTKTEEIQTLEEVISKGRCYIWIRFEYRSPVNENGKHSDSINRGSVQLGRTLVRGLLWDELQWEKDLSYSLAGTLLFQSDSAIVLCKTVVLWIITIFCLSFFLLIY